MCGWFHRTTFLNPAPVRRAFKELKGWKVATPSDSLPRGDWWAFYKDANLNFLIKQVEISNQNVAVQAAAYEQARALIREAQAALFPLCQRATLPHAPTLGGGERLGECNFALPPLRGRRGPRRRPSFPAFSGSWISTSGARCRGRSRAMLPRRRSAPPISPM